MKFINAEEYIQLATEDVDDVIPYKFEKEFEEKFGININELRTVCNRLTVLEIGENIKKERKQ